MSYKKISHTIKSIENEYMNQVAQSNNEKIENAYKISQKVWINTYIECTASSISKHTGFYADELETYLHMHFITLYLREDKELNSKEIKHLLEYTYKYVQSIAYSDLAKKKTAEYELSSVANDYSNYQSITSITIDGAKRANAEALLSQQINRKDQLAFIQRVLEVGKDATKAELKLSERDFNKKFERGLKTIAKYQASNSEEYKYLQALVNELIMTDISGVELTLDDEIEEVYNESLRA